MSSEQRAAAHRLVSVARDLGTLAADLGVLAGDLHGGVLDPGAYVEALDRLDVRLEAAALTLEATAEEIRQALQP